MSLKLAGSSFSKLYGSHRTTLPPLESAAAPNTISDTFARQQRSLHYDIISSNYISNVLTRNLLGYNSDHSPTQLPTFRTFTGSKMNAIHYCKTFVIIYHAMRRHI